MSRADKRIFQENILGTAKEDGGARLFAFTNARQGYQVVFSPEKPVIVLRTKRSAVADQHPCLQWEPLSRLIFERQPTTTHAVFVLDAAPVSDGPSPSILTPEQEELSVGASIGGPLKRVANALTRLNPHNGTLVAAGVSAVVAFKYVLVGEKTLGHRDRLLQHVILVCPGPVEAFKRLGEAVQRRNEAQTDRLDYPLPDVTVLVKPEESATTGAQWDAWLKSVSCAASGHRTRATLFGQARVVADLSPTLFAAIVREAGIESDGAESDPNKHLETPEVYRIAFALSRLSKTIEQYPLLAPLHTPGYEDLDDTHAHGAPHGHGHSHGSACGGGCAHGADEAGEDDESEHDEGEAHASDEDVDEESAGTMLVAGLSSLSYCRDPVRIVLEGRVLSITPGLIGTTEGVVSVSGMDALLASDTGLDRHVRSKLKLGAPVVVSASLVRDARGCTSLRAQEMQAMTRMDIKHSVTVGDSLDDIPVSYNVSNIAHAYGAVLVRGRKCALIRTMTDQSTKKNKAVATAGSGSLLEPMRFPMAPHSDVSHNAIECATEALCQGCEVSADNFYFPSYVSPVAYYVPPSSSTDSSSGAAHAIQCVTLYLALAVNPPPRGAASDAVEDHPEPQEPYDWVSFERALRLLATEPEREALRALQKNLFSASTVGLYQPFRGCGVFGDAVKPLPGDSASTQPSTTTTASAGATPAPSALSLASVSLKGLSVMVLLCPGVDSTHTVQGLTQRVLPSSPCFAFDLYTTSAMLREAMQTHMVQSAGSAPFLLHVADDVDVAAFCEARLIPLSDDLGVDVSVLTVLTTETAVHLFLDPNTADHDDGKEAMISSALPSSTSSLTSSAVVLLNRLAACVNASDAVVTSESDTQAFSQAVWAALALCEATNPEVALLAGLDARRPLSDVASRVFAPVASPSATPCSGEVRLHRVVRTTNTPLAPAAVHYLTHAESLAQLYFTRVEGGAQLRMSPVLVSADVWLGTRAAQQGQITLDAENRCLEITPGTPWESAQEDRDTDNKPRGSRWCVVAHITGDTHKAEAVATLCAQWEALVAEMVKQTEYSASRDGADYHTIRDPLPAWDDGWDDDDGADCDDACADHGCGCRGAAGHDHHPH